MAEGWGDPIEIVSVPLPIAKEVRNFIQGDAFDANALDEFMRAVEKVDPR